MVSNNVNRSTPRENKYKEVQCPKGQESRSADLAGVRLDLGRKAGKGLHGNVYESKQTHDLRYGRQCRMPGVEHKGEILSHWNRTRAGCHYRCNHKQDCQKPGCRKLRAGEETC